MTRNVGSMRIGTLKPNERMLRASWLTCVGLCERGLAGSGRSTSIRRQTTVKGGPELALGFLI